jgi:hypothetical protein
MEEHPYRHGICGAARESAERDRQQGPQDVIVHVDT